MLPAIAVATKMAATKVAPSPAAKVVAVSSMMTPPKPSQSSSNLNPRQFGSCMGANCS